MSRAEVVERRRRATHARRHTSPGLRVVGVLGELLITAGVIVSW